MEPTFTETASETVTADCYIARGLQMAEESALAILDKLKSLPPRRAEAFASSFTIDVERLLA